MNHLKTLRKERNLTQEELGRIFHLTGSSITGYELGRRYPDIDTLILMSQYFCVSVDYLLDLTESRCQTSTMLNVSEDDLKLLDSLLEMPEEYREAFRLIISRFNNKD